MDRSHFRPGDWLIVVGGAGMLIFGLALDWASLGPIKRRTAFDYFLTGGIAYLLVVAAGLVTFVLASRLVRPGNMDWSLVLLVATAVATSLMLLRLILGGGEEQGLDLDRAEGMYMSFLAAAVSLAGAVMNYRAARAHLHDDDWSERA